MLTNVWILKSQQFHHTEPKNYTKYKAPPKYRAPSLPKENITQGPKKYNFTAHPVKWAFLNKKQTITLFIWQKDKLV